MHNFKQNNAQLQTYVMYELFGNMRMIYQFLATQICCVQRKTTCMVRESHLYKNLVKPSSRNVTYQVFTLYGRLCLQSTACTLQD